jgi:lipopolysaccharide transport system ATP-binding protein
MSELSIRVQNLSKQYRLGEIGTGTIKQDFNRLWSKIRGKEDPYLKIGEINDRSVKKSSNYVWALKDINFEVNRGEVMGIVGRNGAGKSTLLKVLSKITNPTIGEIKVNGRIASLLEVGTGFHPELTGRENVYMNGCILGMRKWEIDHKLDEIVDFSGIEAYIDTPVKRYSSGMKVRLGFAVAAHLEPEILVVDEVLAVGDAEFQKKCIGKMKDVSNNQGRTVLFVSHNMNAVQNLCNTAILLSNGQFVAKNSAREIISEYLSERKNLTNYKEYDKYLKYVKIEQVGEKILLSAAYKLDYSFDIPHLGLVFYNSEGTPIFATNPTLDNYQIKSKNNLEGEIFLEIEEPKLVDGKYIISLWFGDSKQNFLEDIDCLTLEVLGMTLNKRFNQSIFGNIVPKTKWTIT